MTPDYTMLLPFQVNVYFTVISVSEYLYKLRSYQPLIRPYFLQLSLLSKYYI